MLNFTVLKKIGSTLLVGFLIFSPILTLAKESNDPKAFQLAYEQVGVYRAWDYGTGSDRVVVAIIDNGFDTFHPDLFSNIWRNTKEIPDNKIDDDANGYVDDIHGWNFLDNNNDPQPNIKGLTDDEKDGGVFSHATVVAGIIGAAGNNGQNGTGLNWQVKLMNLKVLGNEGSGRLHPLGRAVRYAVDNGADVINISMVGDYDTDLDAALKYAYEKGIVVVAAMGNYNGDLNKNPLYPVCSDVGAILPRILGVSATNQERKLAQFSNIGSTCVDITAPGVNIGSTVRYSPTDDLTESYTGGWQGTSFAAPFVSGAAALVKSKRPDWKAPQIYDALLNTVHHTPALDEVAYAHSYGKGLLQVHRALAYANGLPLPPTMFETTVYVPPVTVPTIPSVPALIHAKTFVAVSAAGQMRDAYNDSFELGGSYERSEAKSIESAAAFGAGADQVIVTVKAGVKNERVVSVYNNKWQLQGSWNTNFTSPVQAAIGQRGNGQTVIALAPTGSSKIIYRLYDLDGSVLAEKIQAELHQGVRITSPGEATTVIFTTGNQTMVKTYGSDNNLIREFAVTGMGVNPYVTAGSDITGDASNDIVVGSGPGVSDLVRVYAKDGTEQRAFAPFGDGRKNGVSVLVVDADNNGSKDLLTYSANTSGPIRAWTAKAKNAGEWSAPFIGSFFLLPR